MKEKKHNSNQQSPQTPELGLPIEQDSVQILTAAEDVRKQMQEYFPGCWKRIWNRMQPSEPSR